MAGYTAHHANYLAHRITLAGLGEDCFAKSLSMARVDMKPHQVEAALFALPSPLSRGVILADEVGLGKTIEASLVIAQRSAERRRPRTHPGDAPRVAFRLLRPALAGE